MCIFGYASFNTDIVSYPPRAHNIFDDPSIPLHSGILISFHMLLILQLSTKTKYNWLVN